MKPYVYRICQLAEEMMGEFLTRELVVVCYSVTFTTANLDVVQQSREPNLFKELFQQVFGSGMYEPAS